MYKKHQKTYVGTYTYTLNDEYHYQSAVRNNGQ